MSDFSRDNFVYMIIILATVRSSAESIIKGVRKARHHETIACGATHVRIGAAVFGERAAGQK